MRKNPEHTIVRDGKLQAAHLNPASASRKGGSVGHRVVGHPEGSLPGLAPLRGARLGKELGHYLNYFPDSTITEEKTPFDPKLSFLMRLPTVHVSTLVSQVAGIPHKKCSIFPFSLPLDLKGLIGCIILENPAQFHPLYPQRGPLGNSEQRENYYT